VTSNLRQMNTFFETRRGALADQRVMRISRCRSLLAQLRLPLPLLAGDP
jgi:hypothetical protein